jgi:hypothetical protein
MHWAPCCAWFVISQRWSPFHCAAFEWLLAVSSASGASSIAVTHSQVTALVQGLRNAVLYMQLRCVYTNYLLISTTKAICVAFKAIKQKKLSNSLFSPDAIDARACENFSALGKLAVVCIICRRRPIFFVDTKSVRAELFNHERSWRLTRQSIKSIMYASGFDVRTQISFTWLRLDA